MKDNLQQWIKDADTSHKVWHKFSNWLHKRYGHGTEEDVSQRLVGYEVMKDVEKWCKKNAPEIKILWCDDAVYASSMIILIPHPNHGITIMYIPQCTTIQNQMFLYEGHYKELLRELKEMGKVYKKK